MTTRTGTAPRTPTPTEPHPAVAGVAVDPRHRIGGERVASAQTLLNHPPIDGSPLGEIALSR